MQVVDKVCNILEALAKQPNMSSSEIAQEIDLSVPTAHRLLSALARHGMVEKDIKTKRYNLGWTLVRLTKNLQESNEQAYVIYRLSPFLKELVTETGETATLACISGDRVFLVAMEDGVHSLRFYSEIGKEMPWNAAAPAKLLLALQKANVKNKILRSMKYERYTENTICDPLKFAEHLDTVAQTKLGYCIEELEEYCMAISVPVYAGQEIPLFGLTAVGHCARMKANEQMIIQSLRRISERASKALIHERLYK